MTKLPALRGHYGYRWTTAAVFRVLARASSSLSQIWDGEL
jgi:hypothetical protein